MDTLNPMAQIRISKRLYSLRCRHLRADHAMATSHDGFGETLEDALKDAELKLPNGVWIRKSLEILGTPETVKSGSLKAGRLHTVLRRKLGSVIRVSKTVEEII